MRKIDTKGSLSTVSEQGHWEQYSENKECQPGYQEKNSSPCLQEGELVLRSGEEVRGVKGETLE